MVGAEAIVLMMKTEGLLNDDNEMNPVDPGSAAIFANYPTSPYLPTGVGLAQEVFK